ncbi:MAG TPA: CheR family methyltransferase [Polyangiaceae bacterium]
MMGDTVTASSRLVGVIRQAYGLDLGGARLQGLLDCLTTIDPDVERAAHEMLTASAARLTELVECTTNNETYFFRHVEQLMALRAEIAQRAARGLGASFRVWSAGCSSGEEPLSIAAVLREALMGSPETRLSVLGTDIHRGQLRKAADGRYTEWSFRGVAPDLRSSYFVADGAHLRPTQTLRSLVTYRRHNLLEGPPEAIPFDVVSCRNVLIYFDAVMLQRALAILALAVAPGGLLLLGPAESPAFSDPDFAPVFHEGTALFRRKSGTTIAPPPPRAEPSARLSARMPGRPSRRAPEPRPALALRETTAGSLLERARELADRRLLDGARRHVLDHCARLGDSVEAHVLLAMIALDQGGADEAIVQLERALALEPETAIAHYMLGSILEGRHEEAASESAFRAALSALAGFEPTARVPWGGGVTVEELVRAVSTSLDAHRQRRRE